MTWSDPSRPESPPTRRHTAAARTIPLGRWAGVTVSAHWSVLVVLVLFGEMLATAAFPAARPGHSLAAYWLAGLLTAVVFLVSLLAHELAHAVVARHYRIRVRRVTLWVMGGLTELDGDPSTPRADALIAFAGPAASLGFGAASAGIAWWIGGSGLPGAALSWLAWVSVLLGAFNLLPGAPLDGGHLLRALLWWRYQDRVRAAAGAASAGRVLGVVLVGLGGLQLLVGAFTGLWLILVGWFIIISASGERFATRAEHLRGLRAGEVMTPSPVVAAEWWTVHHFLARLTPEELTQQVFPLADFGGRAVGALSMRDLERVPTGQREDTRLRDLAAARRSKPLVVRPDAELPDIVVPLRLHGGVAVVEDDGRPIGVLTDADITAAAQDRSRARDKAAARSA